MRKVMVGGRQIRDLHGLKAALLIQGFQVEQIFSDGNGGQPYTCVCLADADQKNPTAAVQAFTDSPPQGGAASLLAPDGSRWLVQVGNDGSLKTAKQ